MKLGKFIRDLKLKTVSRIQARKYADVDFGVVKVAFMVAALDGAVTPDEYKAVEALAKKCRGYSAKAAEAALDQAMRSAGYLLLLGRRSTDAELVKAFIREAQAALPNGFAYLSIEEVRRAVVTWMVMGMSDGDYSARERMCVEALRRHFAELKVSRVEAEEDRWLAMSPALRQAYGFDAREKAVLVSRKFVARVEELVSFYGDQTDAARELERLIATGMTNT